jgi:hypothetical protein
VKLVAVKLLKPYGALGTHRVNIPTGQTKNRGAADGTSRAALFQHPYEVGVENSGNLFIANTSSNTIRNMTRYGTIAITGPAGLAVTDEASSNLSTRRQSPMTCWKTAPTTSTAHPSIPQGSSSGLCCVEV